MKNVERQANLFKGFNYSFSNLNETQNCK